MVRRWLVGVGAMVSSALVHAASASAQQIYDPTQNATTSSVGRQFGADFQTIGLQLGTFILHTAETSEIEYNDNIFRDTTKKSDFIGRLKPSFQLTGDFYDTALSLSASAEAGRHDEFRTEDYDDYLVVASARRDITDESNIQISGRHGRIHERRESFTEAGRPFGPTSYILNSLAISSQFSTDPIFGAASIEGKDYNYLPSGPVDNTARSNKLLILRGRTGYQFDEGWAVFFEPIYTLRAVARKFDAGGENQDAEQLDGKLGFTYDATEDFFVELGAGYFYVNGFATNIADSQGLSFNGSLVWNALPNLTLTGTVSRGVHDQAQTNGQSAPGSPLLTRATTEVDTVGAIRADFQASDRALIFGGTSLTNNDFAASTLAEKIILFDIGAKYYFNDYLLAQFQYIFELRDSTDPTRRMDVNRLILSLTAQL